MHTRVSTHSSDLNQSESDCFRLSDLIGILEEGFVGDVDKGEREPDTKGQAEAALG